jgi:hypothetical protein
MNIIESARGHYQPHGLINGADVIIGHSFGLATTPKSPNGRLAEFIMRNADDRPIIADQTLVDAFPDPNVVDLAVGGPVSNTTGSEGGTWGVLLAAQEFMKENDLRRPLQVAQAYHIGRIGMQAEKLNMHSIIPSGLPRNFDHHAWKQWWTRNAALWFMREVPGSIALRRLGQL